MSDEPIQPEESPDFATVSVDGAYIHIMEGVLGLQFYRDISFPKLNMSGVPKHEIARREILHEIRMPFPSANTFVSQLGNALRIYGKYVLRGDPNIDHLLEQISKALKKNPQYVATEERSNRLYTAIYMKMLQVTDEGQQKIVEFVEKLLNDNKDKLDGIMQEYADKQVLQEEQNK